MKAATLVGIILGIAVLVVASSIMVVPGREQASCQRSVSTALAEDPQAVITDLPTYVSNGTPTQLDGSRSVGNITEYSWKISVGATSVNLTGISLTYTFTVLDLYTIEMTVTDNLSRTSTAFEAVNAVLDSDSDDMPDWWEYKYFGNLAQLPGDDFDSDGYLNSEELEDGTNPVQKDAGPGILSKIPAWGYAAIAAAVVVVVLLLFWPKIRQKQKEREKKKIQYALEIEKALEEEK